MEKYDKEADENNIIETLKNDYVENGEYLCSLIRIISSIDCNQTICIDGDWGTGKTFLVNQLIYLIQNYKRYKIEKSEKL